MRTNTESISSLARSGQSTASGHFLRRDQLANFGQPFRQRAEQVTVIPASGPRGFEIRVWWSAGGINVCFGGLEQDFESFDGAAVWVRRAMSDDHRLRIDFFGRRPYRWTLEPIAAESGTGERLVYGHPMLTAPFRKKSSVYRQNTGSASHQVFGAS